jgi:hypothetical protein
VVESSSLADVHAGRHDALRSQRRTLPIADRPCRGLTRDQVTSTGEVAELLHLPVSTVYYLARRGEIPACRLE